MFFKYDILHIARAMANRIFVLSKKYIEEKFTKCLQD